MARRTRFNLPFNTPVEIAGSNMRNGNPEATYIIEAERHTRDGRNTIHVFVKFKGNPSYIIECMCYHDSSRRRVEQQINVVQGLLVRLPKKD